MVHGYKKQHCIPLPLANIWEDVVLLMEYIALDFTNQYKEENCVADTLAK